MSEPISDLRIPSPTKFELPNELERMALPFSDPNQLRRDAVHLLRDHLELQCVMTGTFDFERPAILTRARAVVDAALAAEQELHGDISAIILKISEDA